MIAFPVLELILFFVHAMIRGRDVMKIITTFVYMSIQIIQLVSILFSIYSNFYSNNNTEGDKLCKKGKEDDDGMWQYSGETYEDFEDCSAAIDTDLAFGYIVIFFMIMVKFFFFYIIYLWW